MPLVKLEYGRVDEVSYRVYLALGQGELPRDPSLSHVKWVKWFIQEIVVSHSWVPL